MCLILLALNQHPKYQLIVAANRDEFYARPTAGAHYWEDYPHVLAGRDLTAMGTWLGASMQGKTAMITNYRELTNLKPDAPSRGDLVADFLKNKNIGKEQYAVNLSSTADLYNGYNLLFGTKSELIYFSNISKKPQTIKKGIYGLSNHLLDTGWPKVERGKEKFRKLLQSYKDISPEALFEALYDDIKAPDHLLPDTGVGLELEQMLSSMFIKSPDYGSRCSTIILADKEGRWYFYERVYDVKDFSFKTNEFSFIEDKAQL